VRKFTKRTALLAAGVAVAVAGTGIAYAYWTTTGSGSGNASTSAGTVNKLDFNQASVGAMFPGDSSQVLTVTVKNTGTENAYVNSVKAYVATDKAGCGSDNFLLGGSAAPGDANSAVAMTWTAGDLAPNASADAKSTIQFNNKPGVNQDVCKSAAVTIHYLAS
jgi:hypothetical protein